MTNPLLNRQFEIVREDMHRRYGALHSADHIDAVMDDTIAERTAEAKVETFLPVIVERIVSETLEEQALAAGATDAAARREVLYVCERNAGRSQLASAITAWLAGDRLFVRSVGLNPVGGINPTVLEVLAERGIPTGHLYQKEIVARTVHRSDVVVLMGVEQRPDIPGDRYVEWDIADPEGASIEEVRAIADDVERHVRALLADMGLDEAKSA
ncbi:low molecular weight phosphatase family protein [Corynebacterium hansenii]|uniref:Low molecular weight phosphatase family protein n=1 Tax=Corynebacterium hansenii TaxID=394964 RepID=A0ABV7ZN98_9CORY|nr:low molecular weight phosphatase family protein [Corynebacterium hansenii]WJZ00223.1 Arsenate-mycothiol transferase ArsC2 [Corynebacterium hansenii]